MSSAREMSGHNKPKIYDSLDPHYPDLPTDIFNTNESDEFSDSDTLKKEQEQRQKKKKRPKKRNRKYTESAYSSTAARERVKWEPGIDIHTTEVILASLGSSVTITDYNKKRYRVQKMDIQVSHTASNETDDNLPDKTNTEKLPKDSAKLEKLLSTRPDWSKIRWINVNGLSWEAITTIGSYYRLHRLSIEDMVDIPTRTKVDFFPAAMFGVLPLIKLVKSLDNDSNGSIENEDDQRWKLWARKKTESDTVEFNQEDFLKSAYDNRISINEILTEFYEIRRLNDTFKPMEYSKSYYHRYAQHLNDQRPLSYRNLFVGIEQASFYLLPDGVILTFFESSGDEIDDAILSRISKEETILRTSCDVSILLQNIIDVIVDIVYPIITAYRKRLNEFELEVLLNPSLRHTQSLHLMSGELSNLRRSILPITSLINTLKEIPNRDNILSQDHRNNVVPGQQNDFISQSSKIYFADIVDHTLMYSDEIEGMQNNIDNLIGLIFNTISTDTNNSMKQLSLVTVIFLPLSFWTGYYGMNFEKFGDLNNHVSFYWKIAVPFSVVLIILLTWNIVKIYLIVTKRFIVDIFQNYVFSFKDKRRMKTTSLRKRLRKSNDISRNIKIV